MNLNDYQKTADETATYMDVDYLPLGLAEETGELIHEFAKAKRKGVPIDLKELKSEIGDVLWILSQMCETNGFTLEDVAIYNLAKISYREEQGTIHNKEGRGSEIEISVETFKAVHVGIDDITDVARTEFLRGYRT